MKTGRPRIIILIAYTVVMIAGAKAAVLPKTAQLVPADTIVLIEISDFNQLRQKFEKNSFYKLYKDPAMARFAASFESKLRQKMSEEDDPVIKTLLDVNNLPVGRLAIAMVAPANTGPGQEPSTLLISQWGKNTGKIKEAVEKMAARDVEKGAHRAIESYRDVNLVTLTTESSPKGVPDTENDGNVSIKTVQPPPDRVAYCFIDDCLIAGNDVEKIKFVIAHIQGAGGSTTLTTSGSTLSADSDYISAMGLVGPYHDVDLYVNLKLLLKNLAAEDTTGEDRTVMTNLGLDGLSGLGCSLGFGPEASEASSTFSGKAFLKTTGTRKGILKMLETKAEPVRAPSFVPASACTVNVVNIDIKRAYDELYNIIYGFNPLSVTPLQMPLVEAGENGEPAVMLRPDIIEYLGSGIVISQSINKPFVTGVMPTETLFAISISNRAALEKSLSRVHKRLMVPNNPEPTRELLGHTIYLMGPSGIPFLGGESPMQPTGPKVTPVKMAFTITDTHLIIGQEPAVERAIRVLGGAQSETVATAKWFTSAKSAVPSLVGYACFEDNAAGGELLWWMLKESAKSRNTEVGIGSTAAALASSDLQEFADFSLLPEFDAVRKYFGYSAFYGISRDDGFLFEFKYLNPR